MRKYKRITILLLLFAFLLASISIAADYQFVGSKKSDKYHYPTCEWAKKIKPENLVTFISVDEAIKGGYIPCKVCKPPTN